MADARTIETLTVIRVIIKVSNAMPDGSQQAPSYRTVDIRDGNLVAALKPPGSYSWCEVIGAERIETTRSAI